MRQARRFKRPAVAAIPCHRRAGKRRKSQRKRLFQTRTLCRARFCVSPEGCAVIDGKALPLRRRKNRSLFSSLITVIIYISNYDPIPRRRKGYTYGLVYRAVVITVWQGPYPFNHQLRRVSVGMLHKGHTQGNVKKEKDL